MFIDIIKAKFKEKFPNVNLSQNRVTTLAEKVNGLIKDESEIEAQLNAIDTVFPFAELARLDDVERNAKSRKPEPAVEQPQPPKKESEEVPSWAQSIIDQQKALTDKLAGVEAQTVQEKRISSFKNTIKDLPKEQQDLKLKYFNRMNFENEDDFAEHLKDVSTEVTTFVQSQKDSGASGYKPAKAASSSAQISKAEQEAIEKAFG